MKNKIYTDKKRRLQYQYEELNQLSLRYFIKNSWIPIIYQCGGTINMQKLSRISFKTKIMNRCTMTGRAHSVDRNYKISRILFRELASQGKLIGVQKSSW